jgi:hypothetical protein
MSTRLDIADQIGEDLKKIDAARGYNLTPADIKRGLHKWNDFAVKPAIGYTLIRDLPDEDSSEARWMEWAIYGYVDTSSIGNSGDIYKLLDDIETLIESTDFFYVNCSDIQDIELFEGGVSTPINSLILRLRIAYYS